jgi:hypothetical protein
MYGYVGGNPLSFVDPLGLFSLLVGGSANSTAGFGVAGGGGAYVTTGGDNGSIWNQL